MAQAGTVRSGVPAQLDGHMMKITVLVHAILVSPLITPSIGFRVEGLGPKLLVSFLTTPYISPCVIPYITPFRNLDYSSYNEDPSIKGLLCPLHELESKLLKGGLHRGLGILGV